ncbi:restriction endonuclease [Neobacillus rhizosphaerae]|uniref:restriction endonuclease n=1 Tax=Neobacillus rhizosphaerae TaxID=2880965 RepID=UPI003D2D19F0
MIDYTELPSNGVAFEQLIRELLIRSGFEVHWTGVGPDGGKDLIFYERVPGKLAPFQRKWLVSCKHYAHSGQSVGLKDVSSIIDECEAIGAEGFLLVCSTQPSSSVVKRFEEIEGRRNLLIRYWDGVELERQLNNPSTLPLIHLFFPKTSKEVGWKIFNTQSPSFWAANYKDYFLYLSSRISNSFPNLKDVEEIIKRLESIELPKGSDWSNHYIRPRAIYFDNKHETFSVFADYIYPYDQKESVLSPSKLNEVLEDGQGLYSDSTYMWYITHWDIEYISSNQISDRFHLDSKYYYEQFINNFKTGLPRRSFISE